MSLPRFALEHRVVVFAAIAALSLWGLWVFDHAPRREDPEFEYRTAVVVTRWPGATVVDIEQLVTDPIEEAIDEVDEVQRVYSLSRMGQSTVYIDLQEDIDDTETAWDKIASKIENVRPELPAGARDPYFDRDFGDTSAMVLVVYQSPAPGLDGIRKPYDPRDLELIAEAVRDRIERLPAVARADLVGVRQEVIYLQTDAGRWGELQLTATQLRELVQSRNIVAPGGVIDTELARFGVKPSGDLTAVQQLENLIVGGRPQPGQYAKPVHLDEIGLEIVRTFRDPPEVVARYGTAAMQASRPMVAVSFTMKQDENITDLGTAAQEAIAELQRRELPPDIRVAVVADQPRVVNEKINQFLVNLIQAILIVVLVAFLIVGARIALVMASAIPVVMLVSIGLSHLLAVDLEQVSIASLIVALGMLVDNAIEVGDNTLRFMEEGADRDTAAVEGPRQVATPMLFGTLTTVAAFGPMLLVPGSTGEYIYSLPVVVCVTLISSWFIAMTFTTIIAHGVLRPREVHAEKPSPAVWLWRRIRGRRHESDARRGRGVRDVYARWCAAAIRRRWVMILGAVALFLCSVGLVGAGWIGTQFFPSNYRSQFTVDVWTPEGTPIARTQEAVERVESLLRELSAKGGKERLTDVTSFVGQGLPRFYISIDVGDPAPNFAQLLVNTTGPEVVDAYVEDLRREARRRLPGVRVVARTLDMGPPVEAPIGVRFYGRDRRRMREVAERAEKILRSTEGAWDVHHTWGSMGYQIDVNIDEARAKLAGVTNAHVARSLNAYYSGHYLSTYREGDHQVPIYLRLPPEQRHSLAGLAKVHVEGAVGKVPLDEVADLRPVWEPSRLRRRHGHRMIEVRAQVGVGQLANRVLARAIPRLRDLERSLPRGMWMEIGGEQEETRESQADIRDCFKISLVLILLLLVAKYNSLTKPLIVILTVPLAATGAFIGLWVTGRPLGFMANLGLLSLAGIIVNGAIILIEFVEIAVADRLRRGEGLAGHDQPDFNGLTREAWRDCVVDAARIRLQPLALTSLTTVGGLIPLAFFGGPLWEPMAVVLIFGLLGGTALTLFVLPPVLTVFVEVFGLRLVSTDEVNTQPRLRPEGRESQE